MPGPSDPWTKEGVGEAAKANFAFLQKLFGPGGQALRDALFDHTDEGKLRAALIGHGINVAGTARLMLVDIEKARTKTCGPAIDPTTEFYYVLVLPPVPRRSTDPIYQERQTWSEASFHASNDGYGM